jgi:KamA family protein
MSSSENTELKLRIITRTGQRWQQSLGDAFTHVGQLLDYLQLDPSIYKDPTLAIQQFSLLVPREFASLMERGNPHDPLLLQVLPQAAEMENAAGFSHDPVGEQSACIQPGLLHKYTGRVLWITTAACAIHCRYCFRRHFPYSESVTDDRAWNRVLQLVRSDHGITEFILSGGDPLMLPDERLAQMVTDLGNIPHLQRLRIHSRLPLILPHRITVGLLEIFANS